ncbi:unnamed protein product [Peronospora destructor]|uniref:Secreted protein n=1 Tax=Peronospora destructor TaxID=86335 RepID=A0AAV0T3V8_9STRA|nr:unnamed protein product [Peronospora destructor]
MKTKVFAALLTTAKVVDCECFHDANCWQHQAVGSNADASGSLGSSGRTLRHTRVAAKTEKTRRPGTAI